MQHSFQAIHQKFPKEKKNQTNLWIFGFIAVLYNPIIPVYLYEKAIWIIVNIITIYLFYKNKDLR